MATLRSKPKRGLGRDLQSDLSIRELKLTRVFGNLPKVTWDKIGGSGLDI